MSEISIPGVSSKYNSTKLIDDLVAAERIRLTRLEEESASITETRSSWREVNKDFGDLQRSVKGLYGFENPFSEKNAVSSNERLLTAAATRNASYDEYSFTVKQIASADRFLSPPLDRSFQVKSGNYVFRVGNNSVTLGYRGGTLEDFAQRLSEKGESLVRASAVRNTSETVVLMIEAVPTGSANRLSFDGDSRSLALRSGMVTEGFAPEGRVTLENAAAAPVTASGEPVPEGSAEFREDSIYLGPSASLRVPLDEAMTVEEGMVLEYSYRTVELSNQEAVPPPPPGPLWPEVPDGNYNDLAISSAPNSFELPPDGLWPPERLDDWSVITAAGSAEAVDLPTISVSAEYQTVSVPARSLPDDLAALVLDNGNTHLGVEIKDVRLYVPGREDNLAAGRPGSAAQDAIVEFRGIEARRSSNTIDDLIEGLTINLKKASPEPVNVTVEPDKEIAKDGIIRFVFSYNQLLTRILVLTGDDPAIIDELEYLDTEERELMEKQLGSFRGDFTLTQFKNRLKGIVSNPYPTRAGADLTLLAQMGISTNAASGNAGGALDYSKLRGYLEVDEEKLDNFLEGRIEAVRDLFGRDNTGDLVIDSGIAKALDDYLAPYTQTGGFVSSRISGYDRQLEDVNDEMTDYEEYLEEYEADLKREYGRMEAILNQLESSSNDLNNFSQQNSGR